jgi:hypothetical protein
MKAKYVQPKALRRWTLDIPEGELYELIVFDNRTVYSAVGRYAHSSGSRSCSWEDFCGGTLDELVLKTLGQQPLVESKAFVRGLFL